MERMKNSSGGKSISSALFSVSRFPRTISLAYRRAARRHSNRTSGNARLSGNIENLISATNADLAHTRAELFFFLTALTFISITTISISDLDLLIGTSVRLPVLNLDIGLTPFLAGAPAIILAVHFGLLLRFYALREKCRDIRDRLSEFREVDAVASENLRLRLTSNFLTQWILGRIDEQLYRRMSALIYFTCLVFAPLIVLLIITIRALPLHLELLTTEQNFLISLDMWLIAYFHFPRSTWRLKLATISFLVSFLAFSLVLCVPDKAFDKIGRSIWPTTLYGGPFRSAFAPTAFLLESGIDEVTGRPLFGFSRNIVVTDVDLIGESSAFLSRQILEDYVPEFQKFVPGISLRGRDLRYATLDRSTFVNADFTLADLYGASLQEANLTGSFFGCVYGPRGKISTRLVEIDGTRLSKGENPESKVSETKVDCSSLDNVNLTGATLEGVNLDGLSLVGASFQYAKLAGVSLVGANLVGATFFNSDLTGARINGALAAFVSFEQADLNGAEMKGTQFWASVFENASIIGVNFTGSDLTGARFKHARIWGTTPPSVVSLGWVDLTGIVTSPPNAQDVLRIENSISRVEASNADFQLVERLAKLKNEIDTKNNISNEGRWNDLEKIFDQSRSHEIYKKNFSEILFSASCAYKQIHKAVSTSAGYSDKTYFLWRRPYANRVMLAPEDPAVTHILKSDFLDIQSFPSEQVTEFRQRARMVPDWVDKIDLERKLTQKNCPAPLWMAVTNQDF